MKFKFKLLLLTYKLIVLLKKIFLFFSIIFWIVMYLLYDFWKLLAKYQPFKYFDIIFHKWFEETKQYIDAIKEAETREEKVDLFWIIMIIWLWRLNVVMATFAIVTQVMLEFDI